MKPEDALKLTLRAFKEGKISLDEAVDFAIEVNKKTVDVNASWFWGFLLGVSIMALVTIIVPLLPI